MVRSLLDWLNGLLYRSDNGPPGAGPGAVIFRSGAAALVIVLGAFLGLLFAAAGAASQPLTGVAIGLASFVLLTLAGVAFGRRRTAFDGNHLWIHNSIRWTDPIELTQVLGAHYQFVPRQGPILILVTEHVGTKVLLKPSWMKDVPTPAGMRRVGIALRGIDADALLASLAPALLSGRASIDDNTRNHLLGATARTRAQTS